MNTKSKETPTLIEGGEYSDERGTLSFVNGFDLTGLKRFYTIAHPDTVVVRAWQGHRRERKYFHVIEGSFVVAWVEIDNWESPSESLKAEYEILTAEKHSVLSIPPGYANGLKALVPRSRILVFSDFGLEESLNSKIRFDKNLWIDWSRF